MANDFTKQALLQATQYLSRGQVIAYPTETLWGLGVDASQPRAMQGLYELKQRPPDKAVSVLVHDIDHAKQYAFISLKAEKFLQLVWPGPVTVVLPCCKPPPDWLKNLGLLTIGLRCSSHPFVQQLLQSYPGPITTTSCNKSGQAPAQSAADLQWLPKEVWVCHKVETTGIKTTRTEAAKTPTSQSSTVVLWSDGELKILRPGQMPTPQVQSIFQSL